MRKKIKKKKSILNKLVIFGAITLSAVVLLGGFQAEKHQKKEIDIIALENYFLKGEYDKDLQAGKIQKGAVRERLNSSHVVLGNNELPVTLIQ